MSKIPKEAAQAASHLGKVVGVSLRESRLEPAGYRLLAYLSLGETASSVLARKLEISRPTVTAAVDWLEARNFVERLTDYQDKRRTKVRITEAGEAALREANELATSRLSEVLEFLDPADRPAVIESLKLLHGALNAYRSRNYRDLPASGTSTGRKP